MKNIESAGTTGMAQGSVAQKYMDELSEFGLRAERMSKMQPRITRPWNVVMKRMVDIVLGSIALILLAPLLLIVSVLLMREGGPVFFSQIRVGKDRKRFRCLKFRTMLPNAE